VFPPNPEAVALSFENPRAMHHCTWMGKGILRHDPGLIRDLVGSARFS
jgi:hypothetical protein